MMWTYICLKQFTCSSMMVNYFCREPVKKRKKEKLAAGIPETWHLQSWTDRQPANTTPPAMALTSSVRKISFQTRWQKYIFRQAKFQTVVNKNQSVWRTWQQKCAPFVEHFSPGRFTFRETRNSSWVKVNTSHSEWFMLRWHIPFRFSQSSLVYRRYRRRCVPQFTSSFLYLRLSRPEWMRTSRRGGASNVPWRPDSLAGIFGKRAGVGEAAERSILRRPWVGDGGEISAICAALYQHGSPCRRAG